MGTFRTKFITALSAICVVMLFGCVTVHADEGLIHDGIGYRYIKSDGSYVKNNRRSVNYFAMHFNADGYADRFGFDACNGTWKNTRRGKRYFFDDGKVPYGDWLLADGNKYTFDNGYVVTQTGNSNSGGAAASNASNANTTQKQAASNTSQQKTTQNTSNNDKPASSSAADNTPAPAENQPSDGSIPGKTKKYFVTTDTGKIHISNKCSATSTTKNFQEFDTYLEARNYSRSIRSYDNEQDRNCKDCHPEIEID